MRNLARGPHHPGKISVRGEPELVKIGFIYVKFVKEVKVSLAFTAFTLDQ